MIYAECTEKIGDELSVCSSCGENPYLDDAYQLMRVVESGGIVWNERLSSDQKRTIYTYDYEIDGTQFRGEFHTTAELDLAKGDPVNILVLPDQPSQSLLYEPGRHNPIETTHLEATANIEVHQPENAR